MTRLLLFTNDYPYRTGDVVFVEKEVKALAAAFDDIVVFCHARDTSAGMVDLPTGVHYGGNLFESAPEDAPRDLFELGALRLLIAAAWRELCSGRLLRHPKLFLMGAKVGLTQAHRQSVRDAIAGDRDTVAYGFWAMGGGLGVPWLQGVRARVVRVHRYDLYEEQAESGYLPFRPFLFARADRILAISHDAAAYLSRQHREARGKIALSRLGAHGPVERSVRPRSDLRTVVSCSAVSEVKRVERILEVLLALPGVDAEHPVRWVHFGDGPLMPQLRMACANPRDGLQIDLRGQVPNEQITAFYTNEHIDLLVNLSASEGVPVSIMEAIAHDIPVLATAVGGTPEIVDPAQRSGELVDVDAAVEDIAAVMRAMLEAGESVYAPRELWERDYDAHSTALIAAELVRTAGA